MNNEPGAYIKLEDGTIIPDLNDEAMIERELLNEEKIQVETRLNVSLQEEIKSEGENNGTRTT